MEDNRMVSFSLGGMAFEYDDNKNQINIKKHGISFKSAARIFFDYDRIEFYDEDHSDDEDRYNTIGDTSAGRISQKAEGALIGNIDQFIGKVNEILFVVYKCRIHNVISFRGWHSEWNSGLQVHYSFLFSFLFSVLKIGFVHFIHDAVHILRGQLSAGK